MSSRPAPRRIVVVDDHADAARMFEILLQCEGHQTRIAHDGPSALKIIEEFKPEFVFLDIGMPGMNGYEVARRLRGRQRDARLVIVALTGWGEDSDLAQSRDAGFDLHLVKPVDTESVRRLLASPPPANAWRTASAASPGDFLRERKASVSD